MRGRLARTLLVVAAAAALATAGIAGNFLLLRYADSSTDPVGRISPRATIVQPTATHPAQTAPPTAGTTTDGASHDGKDEARDD
jgi:hypothetical protein